MNTKLIAATLLMLVVGQIPPVNAQVYMAGVLPSLTPSLNPEEIYQCTTAITNILKRANKVGTQKAVQESLDKVNQNCKSEKNFGSIYQWVNSVSSNPEAAANYSCFTSIIEFDIASLKRKISMIRAGRIDFLRDGIHSLANIEMEEILQQTRQQCGGDYRMRQVANAMWKNGHRDEFDVNPYIPYNP